MERAITVVKALRLAGSEERYNSNPRWQSGTSEDTMATEFNPGGPVHRDSAAREPMNIATTRSPTRRNWSVLAVIALIAGLVGVGLIFSTRDATNSASNDLPGITTGQSTTPSPSDPPAGVKGQGESNSTR